MGVSTDAILFYGYWWDEEAHTPYEIDDDDKGDVDEDSWETRYARVKGLPPPSTPFPERSVTPTRENGWDPTPKDYSAAEQAVVDQWSAYWKAKETIVDAAPCLVDTHCSVSYPMPFVAVRASVTKSHRGCPSKITALSMDPAWDEQLADFCASMGIKIDGMTPAWWLVSDWSE
jgi:hypothetical protein